MWLSDRPYIANPIHHPKHKPQSKSTFRPSPSSQLDPHARDTPKDLSLTELFPLTLTLTLTLTLILILILTLTPIEGPVPYAVDSPRVCKIPGQP